MDETETLHSLETFTRVSELVFCELRLRGSDDETAVAQRAQSLGWTVDFDLHTRILRLRREPRSRRMDLKEGSDEETEPASS